MLGLTVFNRDLHLQRVFSESPLRIGSELGSGPSMVVDDRDFSAEQCVLTWDPDSLNSRVRVKNVGRTILLEDGRRLHSGAAEALQLPATLWIGQTMLKLFAAHTACAIDVGLIALDDEPSQDRFQLIPENLGAAPSAETLSAWFNCLADLQNVTGGREDFFDACARALFDPGGMDAGMVIMNEDDQWEIVASCVPHPDFEIAFRPELLAESSASRQTLYHHAGHLKSVERQEKESLVALSPIIDEDNKNVIGFVYGTRGHHIKNSRRGIRTLEAYFIRLIARTLTAKLTRERRELEIARTQALMQQVFPREVAVQLARDPSILEGKQKTVTVMFADLRDFSSITQHLAVRTSYQMITDLMDRWTSIVLDYSGAIVDYYGDGLSAFWNAPLDLENHQRAAVACAMRIQNTLPRFNELWSPVVGRQMKLGIGIATGEAQVGNCGSRSRLKYGPHGSIVNLASRLERVTKAMDVPIVICESTATAIGDEFLVRRLARCLVPGLTEPASVFQPMDPLDRFSDLGRLEKYEAALQALEQGQSGESARILAELELESAGDQAVKFLQQLMASGQQRYLDLSQAPSVTTLPDAAEDRK